MRRATGPTRAAKVSSNPGNRCPGHGKLRRVQATWVGAVAQLGARVNGIHEVTGSIPVSSTRE